MEITNDMENDSHTGIILWIIIGIAVMAACGLLTALMVFLGYLILA
jgi:hypothetical protein